MGRELQEVPGLGGGAMSQAPWNDCQFKMLPPKGPSFPDTLHESHQDRTRQLLDPQVLHHLSVMRDLVLDVSFREVCTVYLSVM